jgi:hypothetical protein
LRQFVPPKRLWTFIGLYDVTSNGILVLMKYLL